MENIVAMGDGRSKFAAEIEQAVEDVRSFIVGRARDWLKNERFLDALLRHHGAGEAAPGQNENNRAVEPNRRLPGKLELSAVIHK